MANKQLLNLIYNPSALCVVQSENDSSPKSMNTNTQVSLEMISEITHAAKNPKNVIQLLQKLKQRIEDEIPLSFRPELFKEMNHVVKTLQQNYPLSREVFSAVFHTLTALKKQIDKNPQTASSLSELEWIELEKCVYLLCNWEDNIDHVKRL